MELSLPQVD